MIPGVVVFVLVDFFLPYCTGGARLLLLFQVEFDSNLSASKFQFQVITIVFGIFDDGSSRVK